MAGPTFEERTVLRVPRTAIENARREASNFRRNAENDYRRALGMASRWELYASLLEQGLEEEEARRRAFRRPIA